MFPIRPEHVRRVSFISRVYPKFSSTLNAEFIKTTTTDGEVFLQGRSMNKDLLSYFGLLSSSQRGASTFAQLPLFRRVIRKLINIVETELESIGAQQVLLPTLIPKKLWHKSNRLDRQHDAFESVYQLKDKASNELLLGPTFEESITQLVGDLDPLNERDLPLLLYQTSQKFRYEPNPRFGLLRSNEFLMKDMYSFDDSLDKAKETYDLVTVVYEKIFKRLGLNCMRFDSDLGSMGGKYSHEYQLPVPSGEDSLVICKSCNYAYNKALYSKSDQRDKCTKCQSDELELIQALELGHTFLLSDTYSRPLNVTIKGEDGTRRHFEMGCYGLGLTRIIGAGLDLFSIVPNNISNNALKDEVFADSFVQMRWPSEVEPYRLGIVTPAKRSKQYHAGSSEFAEKLTTRILDTTSQDVDVIIEDRDKEGIFKRIAKLKCLGIPNIIVIGKRYLSDPPQFEMLSLTEDKQRYEEHWLTEEQVYDFVSRNL